MNTNKGFAPIIAIIIAIVIIAGGVGSYLYIKNKNTSISCTQEAKQCSDGSYVGRTGPNCEFTSCPNISTSTDVTTTSTKPIACTQEAKQCPDGSYVGRTGPKCDFVCPKPVITSISQSSGLIGTIVELKGNNLAGFEGDLDAWIENSKGEKGFLPGIGSTPRNDQTIKVKIENRLCKTNNSYSGASCDSYLDIIPGIYYIYTSPWGEMSNKIKFTVQELIVAPMKPIIYLYPTKEQKVSVKLDYDGKLIADYPAYDYSTGGWQVTAFPDGHLINQADGKQYSYLFWEGQNNKSVDYDLSEGFVVEGEDTKDFFQNILPKIGLTPKEYNEFIVFWYPRMKDNKYNLIHFAGKEYTDTASLTIEPKPDSVLRVFMVYKPISENINIKPQVIQPFERKGFTVIEWGGAEVK